MGNDDEHLGIQREPCLPNLTCGNNPHLLDRCIHRWMILHLDVGKVLSKHVAIDVTFHLKYTSVSIDVSKVSNLHVN